MPHSWEEAAGMRAPASPWYTSSADFPTTPGAFDTSHNGGYEDAFVAKLNPTGSDLKYATFLGGKRSRQRL